jgi:molecular chaperone GrpE (heat shock protein)
VFYYVFNKEKIVKQENEMTTERLIDVISDLHDAISTGDFPRKVTMELQYISDRLVDVLDSVDIKGFETEVANFKARRIARQTRR